VRPEGQYRRRCLLVGGSVSVAISSLGCVNEILVGPSSPVVKRLPLGLKSKLLLP
jgi:hypothetical protein